MKSLLSTILLLFLAAVPGFAADSETNSTEALCPGNWVIGNPYGWTVQNEVGTILPLSASTKIYGCDKNPISLDPELSGASVRVECAPSAVPNGTPDVVSVFIFCN
ncbi:hypothetical protein [Desulfomicrobium salsuginis]